MKIIMLEDNEYKRQKLKDFISTIDESISIDEANSYTSGLKKCLTNIYDLLILDMSMPTYDKSDSESGGEFRTYGGKEIIRQLNRKKKQIPFIIVSQYPKFNENKKTLSLHELGNMLSELAPDYYKQTIFYDTASSNWKIDLENGIRDIL